MKESMEKRFSGWKTRCLSRLDASRKGRLDEDVVPLVSLLNGCEAFFTTSSCSGRVVVVGQAPGSGVQKQNCVWLFISHRRCKPDELESCLDGYSGDGVLKFEPFVLHVQCRELGDAQLLHSLAVQSGFRNSGLSVGKNGKIMAAVRSTHGLEVPLSHHGKLLVTQDYIEFLAVTANQKMEENLRRIHRFYQSLQAALAPKELQELQLPDAPGLGELNDGTGSTEGEKEEVEDEWAKGSKSTVYKRRRKQGQHKDSCHGDRDMTLTALEDCLDLFT